MIQRHLRCKPETKDELLYRSTIPVHACWMVVRELNVRCREEILGLLERGECAFFGGVNCLELKTRYFTRTDNVSFLARIYAALKRVSLLLVFKFVMTGSLKLITDSALM